MFSWISSLLPLYRLLLFFPDPGQPNAKPYYIGKTSWPCVSMNNKKFSNVRYKRNAPYLFPWRPVHSWMYFQGHVFEFGVTDRSGNPLTSSISQTGPRWGHICKHRLLRGQTEYTLLSVDCVARCTHKYRAVFGRYSLVFNNCHKFVNTLSNIMCHRATCPEWCGWTKYRNRG